MAIDPKLLERLSQPIIDIYNELEIELINEIAQLLARDPGLLERDQILEWQVEKLSQLVPLNRRIAQIIARKTGVTPELVQELFRKVSLDAIDENERLLLQAFEQGALEISEPPVSAANDLSILQILESYQSQTQNIFNLTNATLLAQTDQFYRDVIAQTVADVLAGVRTPQQALKSTLTRWSDRGIPALVDRAGRRWGAQEYISMVIRTTSNNVANEMQESRFDSWGVDLIEISSHAGARPLCAPYQGKIFSRSGRHQRYPSLSSTSYGQPAGLFGVNCGHVMYPYIEGLSRKTYNPYPKKRNEEIYKQSQEQRRLEREIRKAKRRLAAMEALGDEEGIKQAKELLKRRNDAMKAFIEATGRTRRRDRERVIT